MQRPRFTAAVLEPEWRAAAEVALSVLAAHDGVAKMRDFLAAGLTNRQVAALAAKQVLERPRNAWYVDPALQWQAKLAVRVGGILACASAVASYGVATPPTSGRRLHVVVPLNSARIRHNRDKRHYVVPGEDVEVELHWATRARGQRGWRTGLVEALLLLVDCVPADWFVAAVDAALHRPFEGDPLMSDAELARLEHLLPRRKQHLLRLVDPRAGSCLETLLRLGLLRRGIGPLVPQFSPDGRRAVDILVGERLILEADGAAFHDPELDAARDAFFRSLGYVVLRFTYDEIVHHLDEVLDRVEVEPPFRR